MIYLRIEGRMGNQMFQYAMARYLQVRTGGELVIDYDSVFSKKGNGYEESLKQFQVAPYRHGSLNELSRLQVLILKVIWRTKPQNIKIQYYYEKFTLRLYALFGIYHVKSTCKVLNIRPLKNKITYLEGWFESAAYFSDIDDLLRQEFQPSFPLDDNLKALQHLLSENPSICVHVRRGDFVGSEYRDRFLVCNCDYYIKGVKYIKEKYKNAIIYVCSNDLEWCKENLKFDDEGGCVVYEPVQLLLSHSMLLMSSCNNFVISNSTLSWWAQHLSSNKDKIVVAPRIWRNEDPVPLAIHETNWIYID